MKWIVSAVALALAIFAPAASAQTTKPDVSSAPSAQSSGACMPKSSRKQERSCRQIRRAVGSSSTTDEHNPAVPLQEPSNISKGCRGTRAVAG
jgi:hypothetical protein